MIGWKIVCYVDDTEVVAEVASPPIDLGPTMAIPVYHNGSIVFAQFDLEAKIKVIEKK